MSMTPELLAFYHRRPFCTQIGSRGQPSSCRKVQLHKWRLRSTCFWPVSELIFAFANFILRIYTQDGPPLKACRSGEDMN